MVTCLLLLRVFAVQRTLNFIIVRTGVLFNDKKRVPRKVLKFFNTLRGFSYKCTSDILHFIYTGLG